MTNKAFIMVKGLITRISICCTCFYEKGVEVTKWYREEGIYSSLTLTD